MPGMSEKSFNIIYMKVELIQTYTFTFTFTFNFSLAFSSG